MKSNMSLEVALGYSEIFDESDEIEDLLKSFSKNHLLKVASYLLGFAGSNSKYRNNRDFISHFFSQENAPFAEGVYKKILDLEKTLDKSYIIPNRISSLQLFEYAYAHLDDEHKLDDITSEQNLFKAYLLFNEFNNSKSSDLNNQLCHLENELRFPAISLLLSFAQFDIVNYFRRDIIVSQSIKSIYLFEFLEGHPKGNILLEKFCSYFGCSDWKEYLNRLLPIIFICYQRTKEAHTDITIDSDDPEFKEKEELIDRLVIDEPIGAEEYDFIKLRGNPIYKIGKGHYRIIFDLFLFELLHTGLYFKLSELNMQFSNETEIKEFRSFYCDDFSEKSLLYSVLERIYGKKHICYSGEYIKSQGTSSEPDYYIRNGSKVFLFESKDVIIPAKIKSSYDYQALEDSLKSKFLSVEKGNNKIKPKAILQLIRNIKRIMNNEFKFDSKMKPKNARIYPILIVHHRQFEVAGLNKIIQSWFTKELLNLNEEGIDVKNVKPITVINIDSLILYQDLFISNRWKLEDMIDDYHKITKFKKGIKFKNEAHMVDHANRSTIPFSHYLVNRLKELKHRVAGPKMILEKGFKLIEEEN